MQKISLTGKINAALTQIFDKNGLAAVTTSILVKTTNESHPTILKKAYSNISNYDLIIQDNYYCTYLLENAKEDSEVYIIGNLYYVDNCKQNPQTHNCMEIDVKFICLLDDLKEEIRNKKLLEFFS